MNMKDNLMILKKQNFNPFDFSDLKLSDKPRTVIFVSTLRVDTFWKRQKAQMIGWRLLTLVHMVLLVYAHRFFHAWIATTS